MLKPGVEDIEARTERDEYFYLMEKHPHVAFNYRWGSHLHLPRDGYRHLLAMEPHIEAPENWDEQIIRKYDIR